MWKCGGLDVPQSDKSHQGYGFMLIIMVSLTCRLFTRGHKVMGERENSKNGLTFQAPEHNQPLTTLVEKNMLSRREVTRPPVYLVVCFT